MRKVILSLLVLLITSIFAQYQEPELFSNETIDKFTNNAYRELRSYDNTKKIIELKSNQISLLVNDPQKFNQLYQNDFDFSKMPDNRNSNPFDTSSWTNSSLNDAIKMIDETTYSEFRKQVSQQLSSANNDNLKTKSSFNELQQQSDSVLNEASRVNPLKQSRCVNTINYYLSEIDTAQHELSKVSMLSLNALSFVDQTKQVNNQKIQNQESKNPIKAVKKSVPTTKVAAASQPKVNIKEIYYKDYGFINRSVIVLDKKQSFSVKKDNNKIVVSIPNSDSYDAVFSNNIESNVLNGYSIAETNSGNDITISTDNKPIFKYSSLPGKKFKIVLDIFATATPSTTAELLSYATFYKTVGFRNKALGFYDKWDRTNPSNTNDYYHYGELLVRKGKKSSASHVLNIVKPNDANFAKAQSLLKKIGTVKKTVKQTPKKSQQTSNKAIVKKQPKSAPIIIEEPEETINYNAVANELYNKYKVYFRSSDDINLHRLLAGMAAKLSGDYDNAQNYLLQIEDDSPLIMEMYKQMVEVSEIIGDTDNANLYRSLMLPEEKSGGVASIFSNGIPIWIAAILMLASGSIVFFLLMIYYNKKMRELEEHETQFTVGDVEYHEDRIKEAYQKDDSLPEETPKDEESIDIDDFAQENPIPEEDISTEDFKLEDDGLSEDFLDEEDEDDFKLEFDKDSLEKEFQSIVDENPDDFSEFDFDNPQTLSEGLTTDEEEELINAEKESLFGKAEDEDLGEIGLSNDNRQKMIEKLMNDGWEIEEIAKELQISQREVEIIAKMQ